MTDAEREQLEHRSVRAMLVVQQTLLINGFCLPSSAHGICLALCGLLIPNAVNKSGRQPNEDDERYCIDLANQIKQFARIRLEKKYGVTLVNSGMDEV